MVYGQLTHKDDQLQVSVEQPALTIGFSELCITSDYTLYMYYFDLYYSSCKIPSMISLIRCKPFFRQCTQVVYVYKRIFF